jgi:cullin-associated NEDD8-dissociated protein 1
MKQADKDFRYMAISDLYNELQKDSFKVDLDGEKKLVARLLEAVARDKAAEVRSLAVKWFADLCNISLPNFCLAS